MRKKTPPKAIRNKPAPERGSFARTSDEMLYAQIDQAKYRRIFAGFLAIAGLVLIVRALN